MSLPTPIAPVTAFVVPEYQGLLERAYEERLLRELRLISIPFSFARCKLD